MRFLDRWSLTIFVVLCLCLLGVLLLAGCSDSHKGQHCVHTHTRATVSKGLFHRTHIDYKQVCDQWVKDQP